MSGTADRAVVVLAAGSSRRMAQCKALLPWSGATLIDHVVHCYLHGGFGRVVVVVGGPWEHPIRDTVGSISAVTVVANPDPARGMLSSLKIGLAEALQPSVNAVAFTPVDVPLAGPQTIAAFVDGCSVTADVHLASFGGVQGHPAMVSEGVARMILAASENTTARAVLAAQSCALVSVDDPGVCANLNTPAEFDAWKRTRKELV